MTANFQWDKFAVRINVLAPVQELYLAWATRKGIESWFLRMSEYKSADGKLRSAEEKVQVGDTYRWRWFGYPDSVTEEGEILEANNKDLFKFSFGKAGICTVRIYKEAEQTIVELVQDEIPSDDKGKEYYHVGCKTGWTFYMANMKSLFEGGIDLRNKDERLQDMLNA